MNHSIYIGPGADSDADYTLSINFAGAGVKSTTMTPDEYRVMNALVLRMFGVERSCAPERSLTQE